MLCKALFKSALKNVFFLKMPRLSNDQRTWVCLEMARVQNVTEVIMARVQNVTEVIRRWPAQWPDIPSSTRKSHKNLSEISKRKTVHNLNKGRSDRPRAIRTPQNINLVQQFLTQDGNRSSRRNGLGLSPTSFLRIVERNINFHPYVLIKRHRLRAGDPAQRLAFCTRLVNTVTQNPGFLDQLAVSDEAIFSLNSEINNPNAIHYAPYGQGHPANHFFEFEQGADSVMVWIGLTRAGAVLGPHFIHGNLNTRAYLRIIRYYVIQRDFSRNNINRQVMWWQQDGASAHKTDVALQYLRDQFPG